MSKRDSREWICDKCGEKVVTHKEPLDLIFDYPYGWTIGSDVGDLCSSCARQWEVDKKEYLKTNKPEKKSKKWWWR